MSSKGWDTGDPPKPAVPPQWAVEKACTSLRLGMKAPEVEQQLVAGGLSAAAAAALVIKVRDGSLSLRHGGSQGKAAGVTKGWDTSDPTDPAALPAWAVEKARACLRLGMKVPEIQQQLVARGLSPSTAEAAITRVLGADIRAEAAPLDHHGETLPFEQMLAVGFAGVCILLGYLYGGAYSAFLAAVWMVFPLWRICFKTGWTRILGWVILILYCLFRLLLLFKVS